MSHSASLSEEFRKSQKQLSLNFPRSSSLKYVFFIGTLVLVCILTIANGLMYKSAIDEAVLIEESDEDGLELNRTFVFEKSSLLIPVSGFPPDNANYDLNGFRPPVSRKVKNGLLRVNRHCKRDAHCSLSPIALKLPESGIHCSEFDIFFKNLLNCEKLHAKGLTSRVCQESLLAEGYWRDIYKVK